MKQGWKRLVCWWKGHIWKSDWELSLDGLFAVAAGLWWPPTTCSRCEETKEHANGQWAEENGYLKGINDRFA